MKTVALNRRQFVATGAAMLVGTQVVHAHNGIVHVTIEKLAFQPADIKVRAGDTIEWKNKDAFAHTATVKGSWEVMIPPGKVATKVVGAGDSVEYFCRFHPNMKGRITVVS